MRHTSFYDPTAASHDWDAEQIDTEVPDILASIRDTCKTIDPTDPDSLLPALQLVADANHVLDVAVASRRIAGETWAAIAGHLGAGNDPYDTYRRFQHVDPSHHGVPASEGTYERDDYGDRVYVVTPNADTTTAPDREQMVVHSFDTDERASRAYNDARMGLTAAMSLANRDGMSMYRLSQLTGISQPGIKKKLATDAAIRSV